MTTMILVLTIVLIALMAADAAMTAAILIQQREKLSMAERERRVQDAIDRYASGKAADEDKKREAERREKEQSAAFDEGIANIMAYAVNGKTGLE